MPGNEPRERALARLVTENLWSEWEPVRLGGELFTIVGCDQVPGRADDNETLFLRAPDGTVYEAAVDVALTAVGKPASPASGDQTAGES